MKNKKFKKGDLVIFNIYSQDKFANELYNPCCIVDCTDKYFFEIESKDKSKRFSAHISELEYTLQTKRDIRLTELGI